MTLATFTKFAVVPLVLLTIGVGGATFPMPGPSDARGADDGINIELASGEQSTDAPSTPPFSPSLLPVAVAQSNSTSGVNATRQSATNAPKNPSTSSFWNYSGSAQTRTSKVSSETSTEVINGRRWYTGG